MSKLRLNVRERQVLGLIALGLSNKEIGRELGISLSTVKTYIEAIFHKLGVSSRIMALRRAREEGYGEADG